MSGRQGPPGILSSPLEGFKHRMGAGARTLRTRARAYMGMSENIGPLQSEHMIRNTLDSARVPLVSLMSHRFSVQIEVQENHSKANMLMHT